MVMSSGWYEADERRFAAHHQPALLIDLLRSRDICSHKILRGTGLFYEDLLTSQVMISRSQGEALIVNAGRLTPEPELSFRWGASWWPGHHGSASAVLGNAGSLRQALDALTRYRNELCPWILPVIEEDDRFCYIHWLVPGDSVSQRFIVEAGMSALMSYCRWMSGDRWPWRFGFQYSKPDYDEQYTVNLGDRLSFDLGMNLMFIDKHYLDRPWQRGSTAAFQVAIRECEQLDTAASFSLSEYIYQWLLRHIQQPVTLVDMAQQLDMSPATLKRKLGKQGCRFQQLQDQARLQVSLYLLHFRGWNNEQVAAHLAFNDTTNFRRAFKRWVGTTPSDCRSRADLINLAEPMIGYS